MSTYTVCSHCGNAWSRADHYVDVIGNDLQYGIRVHHGMPADYCPHCNPQWPPPGQWGRADVVRPKKTIDLAQTLHDMQDLAARLHGMGVKHVFIEGEPWRLTQP